MIRLCAILVALAAMPSISAGQTPHPAARMRDHQSPHSRPSGIEQLGPRHPARRRAAPDAAVHHQLHVVADPRILTALTSYGHRL
jgi:hypothetical protein